MRPPTQFLNFGSGVVFGVVALLVVQVAFPGLGPALERLAGGGAGAPRPGGPLEIVSMTVSDAPPKPLLRLAIVNNGDSAVVVSETRLTVEERWRLLNPHCDDHTPTQAAVPDLEMSLTRSTPSTATDRESFLVEPRNVTLKEYKLGNDAEAHTALAALRVRVSLPYEGKTVEGPPLIVLAAKGDGELNYYFDDRFTCSEDRGEVAETTGLNKVILDRVGPPGTMKGPTYAEFEAAVRYLEAASAG